MVRTLTFLGGLVSVAAVCAAVAALRDAHRVATHSHVSTPFGYRLRVRVSLSPLGFVLRPVFNETSHVVLAEANALAKGTPRNEHKVARMRCATYALLRNAYEAYHACSVDIRLPALVRLAPVGDWIPVGPDGDTRVRDFFVWYTQQRVCAGHFPPLTVVFDPKRDDSFPAFMARRQA